MEQESKSMEIRRWRIHDDTIGPGIVRGHDGEYILYADHAAAMKAAQDAIAVEKRALLNANAELRKDTTERESLLGHIGMLRKTLEDVQDCFLRSGSWPPSITAKIRAALASTAPVAEAGKKEGE